MLCVRLTAKFGEKWEVRGSELEGEKENPRV